MNKRQKAKDKKITMATPTMDIEKTLTPNPSPKGRGETEGDLVRELRGDRSYRDFADYLNEDIPAGMPGRITHQSVSNWEKNVHPVTGASLMAWMAFYGQDDPRSRLAGSIVELRARQAHWVGGKAEGGRQNDEGGSEA